MTVYADNAATTKVCRAAIDAMLPCLDEIYANPSSIHPEGQRAKAVLDGARRKTADVIRCKPSEIYFTSSGSESDNQAILSAALIGKSQGKTHIISTAFEHHAVLEALKKLEKDGFEVTLLGVHEDGIIRSSELADAIRDDTCLVSVMYANNEIGTIQPIKEIGEICRKRGVLFHTDAVQAVGHVDIDVGRDNIDLMSFSAHKFHGPKGAAVLYARKGVQLTRLLLGGGQERGYRAGTENVPAIAGMAAALTEQAKNIEANAEKVSALRSFLTDELLKIPGTRLNGSGECRLPGNINVCFENVSGESLLVLLCEKGICASAGSACMSGSLEPSHVLLSIGRSEKEAKGALRLTLSEENTMEEAKYIAECVRDAVVRLRAQ